jgi:hypothetical protein
MALHCPSELGSAPTIEGARNLLSRARIRPLLVWKVPNPANRDLVPRRFRKGTTWRLSVVRAAVTGAGHTPPGRSTAARLRPVRTAVRAPTGRTGLTPAASCASSGSEPTRASSGRPNPPVTPTGSAPPGPTVRSTSSQRCCGACGPARRPGWAAGRQTRCREQAASPRIPPACHSTT